MDELKTCRKCGRTLPKTYDFFYKDCSRKDGLFPYCIECSRPKLKESASKHKQKVLSVSGRKPRQIMDDDLQALMRGVGVYQWQVAEAIGMSEMNISQKFRRGTLTSDERAKIKSFLIVEYFQRIAAYVNDGDDVVAEWPLYKRLMEVK